LDAALCALAAKLPLETLPALELLAEELCILEAALLLIGFDLLIILDLLIIDSFIFGDVLLDSDYHIQISVYLKLNFQVCDRGLIFGIFLVLFVIFLLKPT